ncbi:MAG: Clostripain family protein [Oscillospiraceae bacterium]|nr:Clostripain family protein [Oscillospiraceae bacterium]
MNKSAASTDIYEAISAQYSDDVRIVYQTGGTSQWYFDFSNSSLQRYVNIDVDIELVDELPEASMGDPDTLADFVSWGIENYPAEKMGLVFWNHGVGSISGVCFDENNNSDSLSLREIDQALNSVYDQMTDKFEFIGFDACLMSTLETANILVPYADYMFASEETEPGGGWNYTDIMNFLAENPDADGAELGQMQCESYYQHCIDNGDYEGATFAITDLSALDELLVSFDRTAKEMYESGKLSDISRAIYGVDNFGGNNRSEGYTNMVDLKGLLSAVQPYAPNASETLEKLENAIVCSVNGPQHNGAGGLSLYYPLSVQGSQELSIFSDICTSSYYLAFVDQAAYGTTGGDIFGYDNDYILDDCEDLWDQDYNADDNIGSNSGDFCQADENSTISVESVYFDEDGTYTVQLADMEAFNYATCSLFAEFDGMSVFLGEDDDVITDYDSMMLQDNFDGSWVSLGGMPLAIETVCVTDDVSVYTCPILLNGEQTNLRIEYDWNSKQWSVIGAWAGIDPQTGAAARETVRLKDGDVITPLYLAISDDFSEYIDAGEYTVSGDIVIEYLTLLEGDFSYSMTLYDVYGNCYFTNMVTFTCDENGDVYFYPDDLG